ncbi:MAG TPA: hypothetical protein VNE42_05795 [Acidimicrobiales bacterium]|nr:hypothetical protein [Acidimicrobiales bacterium]
MEQIPRLPELAEEDARGYTLEVFDQIKELSGVPMVALIYRHMAALSGVLEWAWETLEPVMVTGHLQEQAWSIARVVELPAIVPIPLVARRAAGIDFENDADIVNLLAAFNRANPINAVALRYLARQLDAGEAPSIVKATPISEWRPPAVLPDLPSMPLLEEIDPRVLELISWLSHRDQGRYQGIWPSLYRYLARQPTFLAFAAIVLPPHFVSIDLAAEEMRSRITLVADSLPLVHSARPEGFVGVEFALRRAMEEFSTLIPEMLVVGLLLERAMGQIA